MNFKKIFFSLLFFSQFLNAMEEVKGGEAEKTVSSEANKMDPTETGTKVTEKKDTTEQLPEDKKADEKNNEAKKDAVKNNQDSEAGCCFRCPDFSYPGYENVTANYDDEEKELFCRSWGPYGDAKLWEGESEACRDGDCGECCQNAWASRAKSCFNLLTWVPAELVGTMCAVVCSNVGCVCGLLHCATCMLRCCCTESAKKSCGSSTTCFILGGNGCLYAGLCGGKLCLDAVTEPCGIIVPEACSMCGKHQLNYRLVNGFRKLNGATQKVWGNY